MRGLTRPLAILDAEWTSGNPESAHLVQLAIRCLEPDGVYTEHAWLIRPGEPIEAGAQAVHGIADADVADCPPFASVAGEVAEVLAGADIGGYGIAGDVAILERELGRAGKVWYPERVAMVDGLRLWQHLEPRTLVDAYRELAGGDPDNSGGAHDARVDVAMTAEVLEVLARQFALRLPGGPAAGVQADDMHQAVSSGRLDPAGRFRRREDGVVVYTFGKHRLLPVRDHLGYLRWIIGQDFAPSTLRVAADLLKKGGVL